MDASDNPRVQVAEQQVRQWLEDVVIGLNLCPFAGVPYRSGRIRIAVSQARTEASLLAQLQVELELLDATPVSEIETTLLVLTDVLSDFGDYNQFLDHTDGLLRDGGWEGEYQIASFHPRYQFHGTDPADVENLTNRSPWPILHIIREASIDDALANFPNPERIPEQNIQKMKALSADEKRRLFP